MFKIRRGIGLLALAFGSIVASRAAKGAEPVNTNVSNQPGQLAQGSSPLGVGNNNPFNIEFRTSIQWRGQIGTDGRFAVFDTPIHGIRAGMINIHTKFVRDGANTIRRLIPILSPSHENPTEAFIQFVAQRIQVAPDEPMVFGRDIIKLSKAIVQFENGQQPYPDSMYVEALQLTGKV